MLINQSRNLGLWDWYIDICVSVCVYVYECMCVCTTNFCVPESYLFLKVIIGIMRRKYIHQITDAENYYAFEKYIYLTQDKLQCK